jgi:uncharacterized protein YjiS (DUF1127 family)
MSRTIRPVARWIGRIATKRRIRRAIHELNRLDDHLLADVGLCRDVLRLPLRRSRPAGGRDPRRLAFE